MEVSELRIGNYVNRLDEQTVIRSLQIDSSGLGFVSTPMSGAVTINQIEPIPLTEEWLVKFGFEISDYGNCYKMADLFQLGDDMSDKIFIKYPKIYESDMSVILSKHPRGFFDATIVNTNCEQFSFCTSNLDYVHSLQNLYFALTGEELLILNPNSN